MRVLNKEECNRVLKRILHDFGDGTVPEGKYIFDGITRLPRGVVSSRRPALDLVKELGQITEAWIIFDPHQQNYAPTCSLLRILNIQTLAPGIALQISTLEIILAKENIECDFYLTTSEGVLIAVAAHEDEVANGQRILWTLEKSP